MTLKQIVSLIVLIPVGVILICFIIANRASVMLSLDPFDNGAGNLTYHAPLFVWLFLFLAIGIIIGGLTVWLTQHRFRKALKDTQAELQGLKLNAARKADLTVGDHS
ncbi:LapA family protein [uncultured Bartonella sp.]|uniref:LapA family protein n=1 Tax=uncultured Bartonella sp. TaxID=104108 RepID=UPI002606FD48|nr:LapA family protein [uncultured Bartonella sp.]